MSGFRSMSAWRTSLAMRTSSSPRSRSLPMAYFHAGRPCSPRARRSRRKSSTVLASVNSGHPMICSRRAAPSRRAFSEAVSAARAASSVFATAEMAARCSLRGATGSSNEPRPFRLIFFMLALVPAATRCRCRRPGGDISALTMCSGSARSVSMRSRIMVSGKLTSSRSSSKMAANPTRSAVFERLTRTSPRRSRARFIASVGSTDLNCPGR